MRKHMPARDTTLETSRHTKFIHEKKKYRFARTMRPQRAKMRSAHYINHLKKAVLRLGPLK